MKQIQFEQLSLSALEKELYFLKEQEKRYYKLAKRLKELETKSKFMGSGSFQELHQRNEDEEIEKLKEEIDMCIVQIRKSEEQFRKINTQIDSSNNELRILKEHYENKKEENRQRKLEIQHKGQMLQGKQQYLDKMMRMREKYEEQTEKLKEEVSLLEHEEIKLRKELQRVEFHKLQEENERKCLLSTLESYEKQIQENERQYKTLTMELVSEKQRYVNLNEELITLKGQEDNLTSQIQEKQEEQEEAKIASIKSKSTLQTIEEEIKMAENDLKILTEEYMKETQLISFQEKENNEINLQYDNTCRQALQVWQNIRQMLKLQQSKKLQDDFEFQKIKVKAWDIWVHMEKYLQHYIQK